MQKQYALVVNKLTLHLIVAITEVHLAKSSGIKAFAQFSTKQTNSVISDVRETVPTNNLLVRFVIF